MFRIRAFGNDQQCTSVQALIEALRRDYSGQSVAIAYRTGPNRLLRTRFVDVLDDGHVIDSYGEQAPVDFDAMGNDAA